MKEKNNSNIIRNSMIGIFATLGVLSGALYFGKTTNQGWYKEATEKPPLRIDVIIAIYDNVTNGSFNETTQNIEDSIMYRIHARNKSCLERKFGRRVDYNVVYYSDMPSMMKFFNREATLQEIAPKETKDQANLVFDPDYAAQIGGWNPTPKRLEKMAFSNPYYDSYNVMVSKERFTSLEEAFKQGKKVLVQSGTTGGDLVNRIIAKNPQWKSLLVETDDFDKQKALFEDKAQNIAVTLMDDVVAKNMSGYFVSDNRISDEENNVGTPFAIGFSKTSKIKDAFNQCMVEEHVGNFMWVQPHYKDILGAR